MTTILALAALPAFLVQPQPLRCSGRGAYTIVFERRDGSDVDFERLRAYVHHEQRTCIYRGGSGVLMPLLRASGEAPPLVLVAGKGGGRDQLALLAARPADVAGIVLFEPGIAVPSTRIPTVIVRRRPFERGDPAFVAGQEVEDAVFDVIEAHKSGRRLPMRIDDMEAAGDECVSFGFRRLTDGVPFVQPLPRDLELRLSPRGRIAGWDISIGPRGSREDYMWVVSPPFRTAPQRQIGSGYNVTAAQSAQMDRTLRFVRTRTEYQEALAVAEDRQASEAKMAALRSMGRGLLTLDFTGHELDGDRELAWIAFTGRACVPR